MKYICPKCNADLTLISNNIFKCEYCKSKYNYDEVKKDNNIVPDFMIPFKITKGKAIKEYKKLIKSNILTPAKFKNIKVINKIEGIYVPCYVYDFESNGVVEFEGYKENKWKSSGSKYKKTDTYRFIRGGSMSLERIPIISSNALEDNILDLVGPYDYKDLVPFNPSNIKKYKIYNYDNTKEELSNQVIDKSKKYFSLEMKKDLKDYNNIECTNDSINLYNTRTNSVLIPAYVLTIKYKNKYYEYIVNGQNGKISGSIPINKKIIVYIWILLFILVFSISLLINWVIL